MKTIKEYIEFYSKVRINLKGTTPYQIGCNSLKLLSCEILILKILSFFNKFLC